MSYFWVSVQVDNFKKVTFVHQLNKKFDRFFYTAVLSCRILIPIFFAVMVSLSENYYPVF